MAFVKYSIGGPITSVVEKDLVEEREVAVDVARFDKVAVCNNCGIQHAVSDGASCTCECGNTIRLN